MSHRKEPNILITGTHGTGKSFLSEKLAKKLNFLYTDITETAQKHNFLDDYNEQLDFYFLNDEKIVNHLRPVILNGRNIVEFHGCEFFPESWFDAVFVVRCDCNILHERLLERNYKSSKLDWNIQCEMYQNILDEAYATFEPEKIFQIRNETAKDAQKSLAQIQKWYADWKKDYNSRIRSRRAPRSK